MCREAFVHYLPYKTFNGMYVYSESFLSIINLYFRI